MKYDKTIVDASPLYRAARAGAEATLAGVQLERMSLGSRNCGHQMPCDRHWSENKAYDMFAFLPVGSPHDVVTVVLNGLNDNSYRKFFPWAASLARAGMPALVYPSALLMNRRPRAWVGAVATQRALVARNVCTSDATPINAVLSERVAREPRSLLRDLRQTAADVLDLRAELQAGTLQLADGRRPFSPGTQMHLVGYSLGGYLALTLRLLGLLSPDTRIVTFCAGARVDHGDARANPISPYILDTHAAGRLLDDLGALSANPEGLDAIQLTAVQLLCGATLEMRQRLSADTGLQLYASIDDRVVPAAGIAANLGRVDRLFDTGCHEYPFSFRDPFDRDAMRKIAKSYCVDPEFRSSFCEFIQAVLDVIQPGSTRTYDSSVTQRRH